MTNQLTQGLEEFWARKLTHAALAERVRMLRDPRNFTRATKNALIDEAARRLEKIDDRQTN